MAKSERQGSSYTGLMGKTGLAATSIFLGRQIEKQLASKGVYGRQNPGPPKDVHILILGTSKYILPYSCD